MSDLLVYLCTHLCIYYRGESAFFFELDHSVHGKRSYILYTGVDGLSERVSAYARDTLLETKTWAL